MHSRVSCVQCNLHLQTMVLLLKGCICAQHLPADKGTSSAMPLWQRHICRPPQACALLLCRCSQKRAQAALPAASEPEQ